MASSDCWLFDPKECRLIVFCDGCCINNGIEGKPKRGGIGVYFGPKNPLNYYGAVEGFPTNNIAEIQAATMAVSLCKRTDVKEYFLLKKMEEKFFIKTDSEQVTKAMNEWMPKNIWNISEKVWKKADGKPVENQVEYEKLLEASKGMDIKFVHVEGHAKKEPSESDPADKIGNDAADVLANRGAEKAPVY